MAELILDKDGLEQENILRDTRPETPEELYYYIKYFFGIDVIREPTCPDHSSELDYIAHAFFKESDCVVHANRGGGKTNAAAIATVLESIHKPGFGAKILGGCLPPGEKILTHNGLKSIEDVTTEDMVFGREGWKKVKTLTHRFYQGDIIHICPSGYPEGVKLTSNHLVWGARVSGTKNRFNVKIKKTTPQWIEAGQLNSPDCLLFPAHMSLPYKTMNEKIWLKPQNRLGPRFKEFRLLTEKPSWGFVLGAYVAEGSTGERCVIFSLGRDKKNIYFAKLLYKALRQLGFKPTTVEHKTSLQIRVHNIPLCHLLKDICGHGALKKHIPFEYLISIEHQKQFLRAFLFGDGYVSDRIGLSTSSFRLASELWILLYSLGIHSHINKRNRENAWAKIRGKGQQLLTCYEVRISGKTALFLSRLLGVESAKAGSQTRERVREYKDWLFVPIRKIEKSFYSGEVFNIEVDDNEPSYSAPHIILHNSVTQSEKMYTYAEDIWNIPGFGQYLLYPPLKRKTVLKNGSKFSILTQSTKSVRGERTNRLRCDEIDEFLPKVWRSAQFVTKSSLGISGSLEILSTMHKVGGIMGEVIKRAQESGTKIFKWCLIDVLEKCGPEYKCIECPLREDCRGIAKEKKDTQSGFVSIRDAIQDKLRSDDDSWQVEQLCLRPDYREMVFPVMDRRSHVIPSFYNPSWPLYRAFDFGSTRDPFVVEWFLIDPAGNAYAIDEIYKYNLSPSECYEAIIDHETMMGYKQSFGNYAEPAGGAYKLEFGRRGLYVTSRMASIVDGIHKMRERMKIQPQTGKPTFFICQRCTHLIDEIENFNQERLSKGLSDHCISCCRYFFLNVPRQMDFDRMLSQEKNKNSKIKNVNYRKESYNAKDVQFVDKLGIKIGDDYDRLKKKYGPHVTVDKGK